MKILKVMYGLDSISERQLRKYWSDVKIVGSANYKKKMFWFSCISVLVVQIVMLITNHFIFFVKVISIL